MNRNRQWTRRGWAGHSSIAQWVGLTTVLAGLMVAEAAGQDKGAKKGSEQPFEEVTLQTRDGVLLRCTYYAGPEKKTTVPLIFVHDWDSNRTELHELALFLSQSLNHSVIVPDLRGHGSRCAGRALRTTSTARNSIAKTSRMRCGMSRRPRRFSCSETMRGS